MPFISSARSSYGPQGKKNSKSVKSVLASALGTTDKTFSSGTIQIIDLQGGFVNSGNVTVYAKGGNGGSSGARGGYGALIQGTVPYSALAGKRLGFISGSNGTDASGGRSSAAGGGYSGIVVMAASGFQVSSHICSAAGGGGASGGGDGGSAISGGDTSSIVYSGSPSGGSGGSSKDSNGTVTSWPSSNWPARSGNAWGGGDGPNNINNAGTDSAYNAMFGGGGGGFGPLAGGSPNNTSGPGFLSGVALTGLSDMQQGVFSGGVGGGGAGNGGGSGAVAWRVTSGGGGGGGFQGGQGGSYSGDAQPRPGFAGTSYWYNSAAVQSSSFGNSQAPYLRVVLG